MPGAFTGWSSDWPRRPLPFDHRLSVTTPARAEAQRLRGADQPSAGAHQREWRLSQQAPLGRAGDCDSRRSFRSGLPGHVPDHSRRRAVGGKASIRLNRASRSSSRAMRCRAPGLDDVFLALGEMAAAYIGAEGGMGHLMAAVSTPMVIVNGGFNIERWRPLSNFVEIVEAGLGDCDRPGRGRSARSGAGGGKSAVCRSSRDHRRWKKAFIPANAEDRAICRSSSAGEGL